MEFPVVKAEAYPIMPSSVFDSDNQTLLIEKMCVRNVFRFG